MTCSQVEKCEDEQGWQCPLETASLEAQNSSYEALYLSILKPSDVQKSLAIKWRCGKAVVEHVWGSGWNKSLREECLPVCFQVAPIERQ